MNDTITRSELIAVLSNLKTRYAHGCNAHMLCDDLIAAFSVGVEDLAPQETGAIPEGCGYCGSKEPPRIDLYEGQDYLRCPDCLGC